MAAGLGWEWVEQKPNSSELASLNLMGKPFRERREKHVRIFGRARRLGSLKGSRGSAAQREFSF
jgi:hypothetical protein